jgi:peptidyl-prolyl cis-trans isomerase D
LTPDSVVLQSDPVGLKGYWEKNKSQYKKPSSFELSIARPTIDSTLDDSAAEKEALRRYIDFKKGSLDPSVTVEKIVLSANDTRFQTELLKEITDLTVAKPFLKPRKVNGSYIIIKLDKIIPAATMTFEEASVLANASYSQEMKKSKLQELAQANYKTFSGSVSNSITANSKAVLTGLSANESSEFIEKLFASKQKQGFLTLQNGNVILYNVLAQKLLQEPLVANDANLLKLKGNLLHQKLLKTLEAKYPVKIYVEGI